MTIAGQLEAALVGMYLPSNELIRERSIYHRERMVNLKLAPYLLSKISVFSLFLAIQCVFYLLILSINVRLPADGIYMSGPVELFLTLFLTGVASVGLGLVISSIGRSTEMAIYMLTLLVFFQLFFAGLMFDLRNNPAEPLSYLTTTHWSLLAIGETTNLEQLAESTIICQPPLIPLGNPICLNFPDASDSVPLDYSQEGIVLKSWAMLIGMGAAFFFVAGYIVSRSKA